MRHQGHVVSREMLTREVWKEPGRHTPLDNVIDVHVARLRRKIDDPFEPEAVQTVRGVGFVVREAGMTPARPNDGTSCSCRTPFLLQDPPPDAVAGSRCRRVGHEDQPSAIVTGHRRNAGEFTGDFGILGVGEIHDTDGLGAAAEAAGCPAVTPMLTSAAVPATTDRLSEPTSAG